VSSIVDQSGPLITGRYYHELAIALKDAAIAESRSDYSEIVQNHVNRARYEFEAIGNLRYISICENNHGYLLLDLGLFDEAEVHLLCARNIFGKLDDKIRRAQVDDCLGRLYTTTNRFEMAENAIDNAIASLETDDEEALLAEALTTKASLFCKQKRFNEARQILEGAWRIAERCGDSEGAGRALLILIEELHSQMGQDELNRIAVRMRKLLEHTQQASTRARLAECLKTLLSNS
jgi:tetratricopeptide (TPR) repeat protein